VHSDAAELAVDLLALAGVHTGAHIDAELLNGSIIRPAARDA
jgi:hypothetical protein